MQNKGEDWVAVTEVKGDGWDLTCAFGRIVNQEKQMKSR